MSRMRSFSFPKFNSAKTLDDDSMAANESPYASPMAHSRNSSGASSASSPITSTFSARSHNRWPSSSSSLASTPDSPVNVTKSPLHDLVEDPAEREETSFEQYDETSDDPLCICDTPFCQHRPSISHSAILPAATPEWTPGDDAFSDSEMPAPRLTKHERSGENLNETFASRLSRHWPSMSRRRFKDPSPIATPSPSVRSAPPSRAPSVRMPSYRSSIANLVENSSSSTPPYTPADSQPEFPSFTRPRAISRPQKPRDIQVREQEDSHDRIDMASTPLLPPMMAAHLSHSTEALQSPLQSPKIADSNAAAIASSRSTPSLSPTVEAMPTPPLSGKPSIDSLGTSRRGPAMQSSTDIPPMAISEESDYWSERLGHANFHITPEPYLPEECSFQTCKRLLDDWESARAEYMRVAARISEHYGPTSQTYKFTEQKWSAIDAQWRALHERANEEAGVDSDITLYQPLAETQLSSNMPSLNDPQHPSKFPAIAESDIVGPMVQYAKIQRRPSRKPAVLRLFTDPSSLLGGRTPFGLRR